MREKHIIRRLKNGETEYVEYIVSSYYEEIYSYLCRKLGNEIEALLNAPMILILDEPTAGLDPKERIRFRNLISEISADRIVILSTHIVSDVESIANEILLMKDGMLIKKGTTAEIASLAEGKVWSICVPQEKVNKLKGKGIIANIRLNGELAELRMVSDVCPIDSAVQVMPSLEDAYLYCFGKDV